MAIPILGDGGSSGQPQNLLLGTVATMVSATSATVLIDGATVAVTAIIPLSLAPHLLGAGGVGARVLGVLVGKRFYITDAVSGGSDTAKIGVTFNPATTLANFGAPETLCTYQRLGGKVYLEGVMVDTAGFTYPPGTVLFNLPATFRPGATHIFTVHASAQLGARLDVAATGDVTLATLTYASAMYLSISGIVFTADQ